MSLPAIEIRNVGKRYRIGAHKEPYLSLRDEVSRWLSSTARRRRAAEEEFWALRQVSFEVERGEAVGIIGRNGAGKSTLLKILSQITPPTEGKITMRGRVGSLLEVGTGFHPELTGRENIYMNGAILGMGRREIAGKFDEIVTFAEMEQFLDTPVKRYSSGMYVRLAFAVAAHLDPEILIVDEVLAVGDAQFQRRCLGKMNDVVKGGRTILFVSHNMVAVEGLCDRAVLLDRGAVACIGTVADVIKEHLGRSAGTKSTLQWPNPASAPGNEMVRLRRAAVLPVVGAGGSVGGSTITVSTNVRLEFDYWTFLPGARLSLSLYLANDAGIRVFNTFDAGGDTSSAARGEVGLHRSACVIPGGLLNDGRYAVHFHVVQDHRRVVFAHEALLVFDVEDDAVGRGGWTGKWTGVVRPQLHWKTEKIEVVG